MFRRNFFEVYFGPEPASSPGGGSPRPPEGGSLSPPAGGERLPPRMREYNEWTDPDCYEDIERSGPSPSSSMSVRWLSAVPILVGLAAGGFVIRRMLPGRSSSSSSGSTSSPKEGAGLETPMDDDGDTTMEGPVSCGPWGGAGGTPFSDGRGDIVDIHITHNAEHVLGMETSYKVQGSASLRVAAHGTTGVEGQVSKIALQYPDEYVVQVTGTTDTWATIQAPVVSSLTVVTNKQSYGPYGKTTGTAFASPEHSRVVGFFGRSGTKIDQLGMLVLPSDAFSTTATSTAMSSSGDVEEEEEHERGKVEGPWGGDTGAAFYDGHGRVVEIVVTYHEHQVNSLQVSYEHGGRPFQGSMHGVPAGKETKISFRRPEEYLIAVKGTAAEASGGDATITSLTFLTNQRHFGPFGRSTGKAFESSPGREVTGFFGKCSARLDQLGVLTGSSSSPGLPDVVVQGPWGGGEGDHHQQGSPFCSGRGELSKLYVTFTDAHVVALQATYRLGTEMTDVKSECWGGDSPARTEEVTFHFPDEYLIQLEGTTAVVNGTEAVTSLTFITNQRIYGPYGSTTGTGAFESAPGKVLGFHGRFESTLLEIGVITESLSGTQFRKPLRSRNGSDVGELVLDGDKQAVEDKLPTPPGEEGSPRTHTSASQDKVDLITTQGPWGGHGGDPFYDGRGGIFELEIAHTESQILSLQARYDHGGVDFQADRHGGQNGVVETVTLDFPAEYLVQVQGTVHEDVITSLTIITNKSTYGPYGCSDSGKRFQTSSEGIVVGFYGRASSTSLDQIGCILKMPQDSPDKKSSDDTQPLFSSEGLVLPQGPWGGCCGQAFYDGRGDIVDLNISYTESVITSIQVGYEQGDSIFQAPLRGGEEGAQHVEIHLDSREEQVLQVKGTRGIVEGAPAITSFTVVTNLTTYGPYGGVVGKRFQSSRQGTVVGIFGHSSTVLHQLGVLTLIYAPHHSGQPFPETMDTISIESPQSDGELDEDIPRTPERTDEDPDLNEVPQEIPAGETEKPGIDPASSETRPSIPVDKSPSTDAGTVVGEKSPSGEDFSMAEPTSPKENDKLDNDYPDGPQPSDKDLDLSGVPQEIPAEEAGKPETCPEPSETRPSIPVDKSPNTDADIVDGKKSLSGSEDFSMDKPTQPIDKLDEDVPQGPQPSDKDSDSSRVPNDISAQGEGGKPETHPAPGETPPSILVDESPNTDAGIATGEKSPSRSEDASMSPPATPSRDKLGKDAPQRPEGGEMNNSREFGLDSESLRSSVPSSLVSDHSFESVSSRLSQSFSKPSGSPDRTRSFASQMEKVPSLTPVFGALVEPSVGSGDRFSVTRFTEVEGPWGGNSGDPFYDGTGDLCEIRVTFTEKQVVSLQFVYDSDGERVEGTKVGGSRGEKFTKVVVMAPGEHIIRIKGTLSSISGHKLITSVTFISNKAAYGPYGATKGEEEFKSSGSGKVVGFFGRSGSYVDQLGVFSTSVEVVASSVEGPWGGDGGSEFSDGQGDIVEIQINYNNEQVVSFQATYSQNGTCFPGRIHGGNGAKSQSQTATLNFHDDHLLQVQGTFVSVHALPNIITSLSFITSNKTYGPFGAVRGEKFNSTDGSRVVGFHGRSCDFLDCFGVFTTKDSQSMLSHDGKGKERGVLVQGPWGGAGGSPFYDGRGDIVEILLEYTKDCIVSLQATYEQGGGIFKTMARFGPGGETAEIKLDPEHEQILQIQGSIGDTLDTEMLTSLTFITNKNIYGPFGMVTDKKFGSMMHGKVVGFFGRSDQFLDQIGLITEIPPADYEVSVSQGPWGGKNGTDFYDGKGSIVGIIVTYNKKHVISLQAIYNQGGAIFKANFHGGPGGKTTEIFFNAANEELVQVKGTTSEVDGDLVVTSLTFFSNKRVFGPFGSVEDVEFESSPNGKVKGFYGKAGMHLDQIGFITHFSSSKSLADEVVAQGPWGGSNGHAFYGGRGVIVEIFVWYNKAQILSLQMVYDHNGTFYNGVKQGENGGEMAKISLRDTNAYLMQVKGTFGKVDGTTSITSLTFITSESVYGPFGSNRGTHFQSYQHGKIVGFFGNSSTSIDQLGVITQICIESDIPQIQMNYMGPWGGHGGEEFHDGHGHIREIHVHYTKSQVVALQVVYEQGGRTLEASNHGGISKEGLHIHHTKISIKGSGEHLTKISGTYGLTSRGEMITSLTFITNKKKYGRFGHKRGESFKTPIGKIVGFFGRSGEYLNQIGVVMAEERVDHPIGSSTSAKFSDNEKSVLVEGPWGVNKDTNFCNGRGNIVEIEVAYNKDYIVRIQTTYQENGTNFKQGAIGGQGGEVAKIVLQFPDEYLVQVKGTTGEVSSLGVAVTSLMFVTNKKAYGPYGSMTGASHFETTRHGKVMGFYGRATTCLRSVGVLVEVEDLPIIETVIVQDSWGGQGGEFFYDGKGDVTEVIITYNDLYIVSLQATYTHGGKIFKANEHGGRNGLGARQSKISLKYPKEYLVQVKGTSHLINGLTIIESLEFITNKKDYGPYGALHPQGQLRSTPKHGKIIGFFGKADHFVDQLGVVISFPSQREDLVILQGSWGGTGGSPFSDGRGEIVELTIKYNKMQIISLLTIYEQGDTRYKSQLRGGLEGGETSQISFEDGEYLAQVKGTTGLTAPSGTTVTSLTFITNKRTHGPFGSATGDTFETRASGKVVGFFGRCGSFLDSIGFITELCPGKALPDAVTLGPWGGQGGREFYGGQGDIVKIRVYYNESQVNGIQTTYEQGGVTFDRTTFGSTTGDASKISLDFPSQHLIQVRGTTEIVHSHQVITSLSFITNKHTYGPYGAHKGSSFATPAHRLVTGFYGKAGDAVDQLGVFATASLEATDNYLRIYRDDSWGAFIRREVSSAAKYFKESFGQSPESSLKHSKSPSSGSGSLRPWKP